MNNNNRFEYNYSAPSEDERREIESIRRRYTVSESEEGGAAELRRLDFYVRSFPVSIALSVGIIGLLIFGFGMAMVLELGQPILGAVLGAVGLVVMLPANFIYKKVLAFQKKKYGARILDLSEKLLSNDSENEKSK